MPSQHIDLSLLSGSAAAASERDAIHHAAGYQTNLRHYRHRRRQKTSQSRGSANCPATGHRCGLHRHSRERVILRNYCSGSPRRNACPAGPVQSIGGDAMEKEATMTTRTGGDRDVHPVSPVTMYMRSTCIDTRTSAGIQDWTDRQTVRQREE